MRRNTSAYSRSSKDRESYRTPSDSLQVISDQANKPESPMQKVKAETWQIIACFLGTAGLICLSAMFMSNGRLTITVKLKDWLEVHTEVDKRPASNELTRE